MKGTMKVAVMNGIGKMGYTTRPIPTPKEDEVLVKLEYVGICGSDMHYYETGAIGNYVVKPPFVLGHEPGGTVVEVGSAVKHLKVGDRVALEPGKTCGHCKFCREGKSLVLVSLGAKGAYYRNAVGAGHLPTYDVPTVDTTGAGDAFMGAIHYQLRRKAAEDLRTLPAFELEEIVRFGNAAGSLTTTKGGAIPAMPSMVEIQNCIASIPLM